MALFESYERRIDQINAVLSNYGISSLEEAEKITKDAGLDVYDQVKKIQPICFEWALQLQLKKAAERLLTLLLQSEKAYRLSVSRDLLQTTEK